jgi:hypothetical protein
MTFASDDLSEAIMEAMILLDPPNLAKFSSQLSILNILQAFDIALRAASIEIFTPIGYASKDIECDNVEREKNLEVAGLLADLYRIIILSSSLLLEMCPWREDPTNTTSNTQELPFSLTNERAENLCQNINRSILLLETLSHFSYFSKPLPYNDWHDELLPKSRHPLLQECFERKALMDVEENVLFGMEDRLVSLNIDDYVSRDMVHCHAYGEDVIDINGTSDHELLAEQSDNNGAAEGADVSLSLSPKQLMTEEEELLNIALPYDGMNKRLHPQNSKEKVAKPCQPEKETLDQMKNSLLIHHIQIPFYGLSCVLKQGWLILKQILPGQTSLDTSCHVVLFTNGVIAISEKAREGVRSEGFGTIKCFSLDAISICSPTPQQNTFHFTIDNLRECEPKSTFSASSSSTCSILFGMDENLGGSLMEGYGWMSTVQESLKQITKFCKVQRVIEQKW